MDIDKYQENAMATAIYPGRREMLGLVYTSLKLAGEAGEVSDKVGKLIRDKNVGLSDELSQFARRELARELGDVLWYISAVSHELGYSLSAIAEMNLIKLQLRQERGTLKGDGDDR